MTSVPVTRGLQNNNYSCYVNVILQVLARSPSILNWCREYVHSSEEPPSECIKCILRQTIMEMREPDWNTPYLPEALLRWIRAGKEEFAAGVQADPFELLEYLMEKTGLDFFQHDEVEKVASEVEGEIVEQSVGVIQPGLGTHHAVGTCTATSLSVRRLLQQYIAVGNSKSCNEGDGKKCIERTIYNAPEILMMKINRFALQENVWKKNCTPCYIDQEVSITTQVQGDVKYSICGVVEHWGLSPVEGHYIAKVVDNGQWWSYSDDAVEEDDVSTGNCYLIFYVKTEDGDIPVGSTIVEDDNIFDEQELLSVGAEMEEFIPENPENIPNGVFYQSNVQAHARSWRKDFSSKTHLEWITKCRLLVMCIPKTCEGNSFKESYEKFMDSTETILYTITYYGAKFLEKLRTDPVVKEKYNIYIQKIGPKFEKKSVSLWVAEAATFHIVNTHVTEGLRKLEFFFDLNEKCIIPSYLIKNWEQVKRRVVPNISRCLKTEDLFCLDGCSNKCFEENMPFHRSICNMTLMPPPDESAVETSLYKWRFANNSSQFRGHPLEALLTKPSINVNEPICPQVVDFLNECEIDSTDIYSVYFLMVVDSQTSHEPDNLYEMWSNKTADFSVYVGLTNGAPFRKRHLADPRSPVSKKLTATSTVFLIESRNYSSHTEGAIAEAQLIAVLRRFEEEERKSGMRNNFEVLNRCLPLGPLFESNPEQEAATERFILTGKRPFRFINEPYEAAEDEHGILQRFLVSRVVRQPRTEFAEAQNAIDDITERRFRCHFPNCNKTFTRKTILKNHTQTKHLGETFICDYPNCNKRISTKTNLMTHKQTHLGVTLVCDFPNCGRRLKGKGNMIMHKKTHLGRRFKCTFYKCGRTFMHKRGMKIHKITHQGRKFKCTFPNCGKSFTSKEKLIYVHQKIHQRRTMFECDYPNCGKKYKTKRTWIHHKQSHEGSSFTCDYPGCGKTFQIEQYLKNHERTHREITFACDFPECGKKFKQERYMQRHRKTHGAVDTFHCDFPSCEKSFEFKSTLILHQRAHTEKVFECDFPDCGRTYKNKSHLTMHKQAHLGRTFDCDFPNCDKSFSRRNLLVNHKRMHTGNLLECEFPNCGKKYTNKSALVVHHKKNHPEIIFACDFPKCGKTLISKDDLIRHKQTHAAKVFVCDIPSCGKAYKDKCELTRHMHTHSGSMKPRNRKGGREEKFELMYHQRSRPGIIFKCDYPNCKKRYLNRREMMRHKQEHDARIYVCDFPSCDKAYKYKYALQQHEKTHNENP